VTHPAVRALVEYLRRERVPRRRPGLLGDVLPHPLPVALVGRDVALLERDLIGRQEAHDVLLVFLDLRET